MQLKKGFSLIEVIIFTSILSIIFVAAASVMTYTMKQNSVQIDKLFATHYTEELSEWLKGERELGWSQLAQYAVASYPSDSIYCFGSESPAWTPTVNAVSDCAFSLDSKYRRTVTMKADNTNPTTRIQITVTIDWMEGTSVRSTQLHSVYSL